MKYGLCWYAGIDEHDYEETSRAEYATLRELLDALYGKGTQMFGEEMVFDALYEGRQDTIHWVTDNSGFAFYRPAQPQQHS